MSHLPQFTPRAFAALEALPALRASVEPSLRRQAARAAACLSRFCERPAAFAAIETALATHRQGLIVLEGPPGSGVTSLLAALAARSPHPLWLSDDAGDGMSALYAQIVALHRPTIPLIDPAVATDSTALDRLLTEVAATRATADPIVLLIDRPGDGGQPLTALPPALPAQLPRGVLLILGGEPGAQLPIDPVARITLPVDSDELAQAQAQALTQLGCPPAQRPALIAAAHGSFGYLALAHGMLQIGLLAPDDLPVGMDGLLAHWWAGLAAGERRLAALLAAAGEPLPLDLATAILDDDPAPILDLWEGLGLVDLTMQAASAGGRPELLAEFAHHAPRRFLADAAGAAIDAAHADVVALTLRQVEASTPGGRNRDPLGALFGPQAAQPYLTRQLARHATLTTRPVREDALTLVGSRAWLRAHERHAGQRAALGDLRWELRAAASGGQLLRLVQATALVGTLATQARNLSPDAAVEALTVGLSLGGREQTLKRIVELVEHLPDGLDKAQILRRLGEACYGARMRTSAMRLLSRALDLEAQPTPLAWREQRDQLYTALAGAALGRQAIETALAIAERIEHLERRAAIETQVVRALIATGERDRAQRLARGILHESMGAWARAEVSVELVRADDPRGAMMLEEITIETVAAWAQIELACGVAAQDLPAAMARIAALPSSGQRDRGLAHLAKALATYGMAAEALAMAGRVSSGEGRVAALLDLLQHIAGEEATLALDQATRDIDAIGGDDRGPLLAALAAANAALGLRSQALAIVASLAAGEERDRAMAKVAVGLAQYGDHDQARRALARVGDDDERDWARDEIAHRLAAAGHWDAALALAGEISAEEQRARTGADLAITRARGGDMPAALAMAFAVELPQERARALTMIGAQLGAAGQIDLARSVERHPDALTTAEARGRYLAATVSALAEAGHHAAAGELLQRIARPTDRVRAGLAFAATLATVDPAAARSALGDALRVAAVGREEAFRALELAAPALAALGGAELLGRTAEVIAELDG